MSQITFSVSDGVASITLNNPQKLNCFTPEMLLSLEQYLTEIEQNSEILALVVSAAPCKAFCAGAQIDAWATFEPMDFARHWVRHGHRVFDRLARLSIPTISAISGLALGGGMELATATDIRLSSPDASFGLPENQIGIVPGWSGTQRLQRLLPEGVLKEMVLFGRRISAERAFQLGYIAQLCDAPIEEAHLIAQKGRDFAPRATEIAKMQIHAGAGEDTAALVEALGGAAAAATHDKSIGVKAFAAKSKPEFKGN